MHPLLIALGPAFKKNFTSDKVINQIDLYPLMCNVLKIEANPNRGDMSGVAHLLDDEEEEEQHKYTILTCKLF